MDPELRKASTQSLDGADWNSADSFIDPRGLRHSQSWSNMGGMMSPAQMHSASLRDCTNPLDLKELLFEVWTRQTETPEPFSVESGAGVVHDLDVSELLFYSEGVCKKLISFIGFHQTDMDAKTAAMDVFTWFCTQPALLKSMFVGREAICNWVLSLVVDTDPEIAATGLKGLVNLAKHDVYRKALHRNEELIRVLHQMNLDTKEGRRAATLAFMLFHTIILAEGTLKKHDDLVKKLEELAFDARLASAEEQYWRLNCFQAAVILSERRVELMDTLASKLPSEKIHEQAEELLLDERVNLYLSLAAQCEAHGESLIMDSLLGSKGLIAKLFKSLPLATDRRRNTLKLLVIIARDSPHLFFDGFLDDNLPTLVKLLEEGSPEEHTLVLELFTAVSYAPYPKDKHTLHPQHGFRFVELLVEDMDEQKLQILSFVWTHYKDAAQAFIAADAVRLMMSLYSKPENEVSMPTSEKVKEILSKLLEDRGSASAEIQDKVIGVLKTIIDSSLTPQSLHNLRMAAEVMSNATRSGRASKLICWFVEEGLAAIINKYTQLSKRRLPSDGYFMNLETLYSEIYSMLEDLMRSSVGHVNDRNFFLKKFVTILGAVNMWPQMIESVQHHSWETEFAQTEDTWDLSVPLELTLGRESLMVLGELIVANQHDRSGFLYFLLWILLEVGLHRGSAENYSLRNIAKQLSNMLDNWKLRLNGPAAGSTCQMFLQCITALVEKDSNQFQGYISVYERKSIRTLWDLVIENGQEVCNNETSRRALLSFLRDKGGSSYR